MFSKLSALGAAGVVCLAMMNGSTTRAATIPFATTPLTVSALSATGTSVNVSGPITPTDSIDFTVTGLATLQPNGQYQANAAGVVVVAGEYANETVGTVENVPGSTVAYASLQLTISGLGTATVFAPDAANGLGSSNAPQTITFDDTLGSLFGNFASITDPTFTFSVADGGSSYFANSTNDQYFDNSGGFTVTDPVPNSVPLPSAAWQSCLGLAVLAGGTFAKRRLAI